MQSQVMKSFLIRPIASGSNTSSLSLPLSRHVMVVELYLRPGMGKREGAEYLKKSIAPVRRPHSKPDVYALVMTFSVNGWI